MTRGSFIKEESSFEGTGKWSAISFSGILQILTSRNDCSIITRESRVWWVSGRRPPQMICGVRKEVHSRLMEERRLSTIALGQNDFVEELD